MRRRTTFNDSIRTRSGRSLDDNQIFVTISDAQGRPIDSYIRRKPVKNELTDNKIQFRNKHRSAVAIWKSISQPFKNQLIAYTYLHNTQNRKRMASLSAFNIFIGMLLSKNHIFNSVAEVSETFGNTIKEWIENGHINPVKISIEFDEKL